MQYPKLVDGVEQERDDEDLSHRFPSAPQEFAPVPLIGEKCPEIGRPPRMGVLYSIQHRKDNGHKGLEDYSEMHGAANPAHQVFKHSGNCVFHAPSLFLTTSIHPVGACFQ